ncbi:hypothetical protein OG524_01920 [Streptomyces sp. NBC_01520]|uniref:hypothetical protein n=1 Tax=Streptomyces sp. NBC_01520 TaxID=2903892 RepID=UPI0038673C74
MPYTFENSEGEWACDRPENPDGAFVCDIGQGGFMEVLDEGGTTAIDFRIDRQVPGARGTIRTYNRYDRTAGNDLAVIPLDASPALPCRPHRDPVVWAVGAVGAVTVVVLVAPHRWRRRVSGREDARASRA